MKHKAKGFSLVEILIVVGIIGLILTLVVVALNSKQKEIRDIKRVSDMQMLRSVLELVKNETGSYDRTFCEVGAVSACGGQATSPLLRFIPNLRAFNDPKELNALCDNAQSCQNKKCNYAFVSVGEDSYQVLFHLERGVEELPVKGCYLLESTGISKL